LLVFFPITWETAKCSVNYTHYSYVHQTTVTVIYNKYAKRRYKSFSSSFTPVYKGSTTLVWALSPPHLYSHLRQYSSHSLFCLSISSSVFSHSTLISIAILTLTASESCTSPHNMAELSQTVLTHFV